MIWKTAQIIEALATIKANTANHKEDLQEFKDKFDKHIEKEEKETVESNKKMEDIKCSIQNFECPHNVKIEKIERRFFDSQKQNEGRRLLDAQHKTEEIINRAAIDKKVAEEISSLKTTRKYNILSASGIYAILAVILKKIFTP